MSIFLRKPISVTCLIIALLVLLSPIILRRSRKIRAKIS
jgi:TctA family transporter